MNTKAGYAAAALALAALLMTPPTVAEEADREDAEARVSSAEIAAQASKQAAAEASRAILRDAEKDLDLRLNALISADSDAALARGSRRSRPADRTS